MAFIGTVLLTYPLNSRLGGSESRSGCFGTGENLLPLPGIEFRFLDLQRIVFIFPWCCDPTRARASSFLRFLDHTQRRTTFGRTPLDKWSVRRKDYLTTHNTHNRHPSIHPPSPGFAPTIPTGEQPQTHASDRAATETSALSNYYTEKIIMALEHCVCACDACPWAEGIHSSTFSKYVRRVIPWKELYAVHWTETRGPRFGVIRGLFK